MQGHALVGEHQDVIYNPTNQPNNHLLLLPPSFLIVENGYEGFKLFDHF
jgi:hypothetical protein